MARSKETEISPQVKELAKLLKERREQVMLTHDEVAKRSGCGAAWLRRFEAGNEKNPNVATLFKLASAVDAEISFNLMPRSNN